MFRILQAMTSGVSPFCSAHVSRRPTSDLCTRCGTRFGSSSSAPSFSSRLMKSMLPMEHASVSGVWSPSVG